MTHANTSTEYQERTKNISILETLANSNASEQDIVDAFQHMSNKKQLVSFFAHKNQNFLRQYSAVLGSLTAREQFHFFYAGHTPEITSTMQQLLAPHLHNQVIPILVQPCYWDQSSQWHLSKFIQNLPSVLERMPKDKKRLFEQSFVAQFDAAHNFTLESQDVEYLNNFFSVLQELLQKGCLQHIDLSSCVEYCIASEHFAPIERLLLQSQCEFLTNDFDTWYDDYSQPIENKNSDDANSLGYEGDWHDDALGRDERRERVREVWNNVVERINHLNERQELIATVSDKPVKRKM